MEVKMSASKRAILVLAFVAAFAGTTAAQEVVRLKNGRVLSGTLSFEGDIAAGFTLKRWDTGGSVFILWSQIPDSEASRLRNRGTGPDSGIGAGLIDGVKVITGTREITGVVTSSDAENVTLKNKDGTQKVPRSAILQQTPVKVPENEIYNNDEMIDRRAKEAPDSDYAKLVEVGNFARSLRSYAKAKDFYKKADAVADAAHKSEVTFLLQAIDLQIREESAEKALANVWRLASDLKYDEAIQEANKFLTDYAESETGKANSQLLASLEAKKKEFQANRDKVLGETIPEQWRNVRQSQIVEVAQLKEISKVREGIANLDNVIAQKIGDKFKCTPDEATKHWGARTDKKMRTASLRDGTWIYKNGQEGGLDYSGNPDAEKKGSDQGGRGDWPPNWKGGQDPNKKPVQYGMKLESTQEWWESASSSTRKEWCEAMYGLTSTHVKREPEQGEEKDCPNCKGQGKIKTVRFGKTIAAICHECHDVKKVLTVKYW